MIVITKRLREMERYADDNNIPIINKEGLKFLLDYIKKNKIKSILEIGSAIGYSAINMALVDEKIMVTTIEKNETRYLEALKNIKDFQLEKRINLVLGDALDLVLEEKYDLIFIDAAKSKYVDFFMKYQDNLKRKGSIVTDNIYFHGLVYQKESIEQKQTRKLVEKIKEYMLFLKNNKEFESSFYEVGDGISVSKRSD
ncbi:MAG: O-methyltransferase [Bacilli bacterium]